MYLLSGLEVRTGHPLDQACEISNKIQAKTLLLLASNPKAAKDFEWFSIKNGKKK